MLTLCKDFWSEGDFIDSDGTQNPEAVYHNFGIFSAACALDRSGPSGSALTRTADNKYGNGTADHLMPSVRCLSITPSFFRNQFAFCWSSSARLFSASSRQEPKAPTPKSGA